MIAFAVGHGLYVAAYLKWNRAPALALLAPVSLYVVAGLWMMLPGTGALMLPLVIYVVVIWAMIRRAAACALVPRDNLPLHWNRLAGAPLFGFSDILLGVIAASPSIPR